MDQEQTFETVPIASLRPNPYRNLVDYPLSRAKVEALKTSIRESGWYANVVARRRGDVYEVAYGHHRTQALVELHEAGEIGPDVNVIHEELDDQAMIRRMSFDNREEFGPDILTDLQDVEAVLRAYAEGRISLPPIPAKTPKASIRHVDVAGRQHPYTVRGVAETLGWLCKGGARGMQPNTAAAQAFELLDAIAVGAVSREQLRGLSRSVAAEIVSPAMALHKQQEAMAKQRKQQAEEAERRAAQEDDTRKAKSLEGAAKELQRQAVAYQKDSVEVAKDFAKQAVDQVKKGHWSRRDVREAGNQAKSGLIPKREQKHKTARQLLDRLKDHVYEMLNPHEEPFKSLRKLFNLDCGLMEHDIVALRDEVGAMAARAVKLQKDLDRWKPPAVKRDAPKSPVKRLKRRSR